MLVYRYDVMCELVLRMYVCVCVYVVVRTRTARTASGWPLVLLRDLLSARDVDVCCSGTDIAYVRGRLLPFAPAFPIVDRGPPRRGSESGASSVGRRRAGRRAAAAALRRLPAMPARPRTRERV